MQNLIFLKIVGRILAFYNHGKKQFITAWQKRKKETIVHPYLNEIVEIGLLPHIQAMLLARYIRNDIDDYPVFLIK